MSSIEKTFVALCVCVAGHTATAQTIPNSILMHKIVDCEWLVVSADERTAEQRITAQAFEQVPFKENTQTNLPEYIGRVSAFGTHFDQFRGGGVMGGAFLELQGAKASLVMTLKYFTDKGRPLTLVPSDSGNVKNQSGRSARTWRRQEVGADTTIELIVMDKLGGLDETNDRAGVSMICVAGATSNELAKSLGLESLPEIQRVVTENEIMPESWGNAIINGPSKQRMRMLASYARLSPAQINALLVKKDDAIARNLLVNKPLRFSTIQFDQYIDSPKSIDTLALTRLSEMSMEQQTRVMARASTGAREILPLRRRDDAADALLMRIIDGGVAPNIMSALWAHGKPNSQHIDRILESADTQLRRDLTFNIKFAPTLAQMERILKDAEPDVRIGLLRRDDVTIPAQLVSAGINHPDKNLQFWYQQRKDYSPSAVEIETGLISTEAPVRRGWLMRTNITLTQAQIDRAFHDDDTRSFVAVRKDVKLSSEQIDRCITDSNYFVRDTCVRRADFELTPARFTTLMRDKNPNIQSSLARESVKRSIDLAPFVRVAFEQRQNDILQAIGKTRELPITDAQLNDGLRSPVPEVRAAFCRRAPDTCKTRP